MLQLRWKNPINQKICFMKFLNNMNNSKSCEKYFHSSLKAYYAKQKYL